MRAMRPINLGLVIFLSMVVLPLATTAQGNSGAAHACQRGGYRAYTDAAGNGFKNAGQCTSYAARGGTLVPLPGPDLSWEPNTLSGTGFTPNTYGFQVHRIYSPSGLVADSFYAVAIDGDGSFSALWFVCSIAPSDTSFTITVTDTAGISHTESFAFNC